MCIILTGYDVNENDGFDVYICHFWTNLNFANDVTYDDVIKSRSMFFKVLKVYPQHAKFELFKASGMGTT